MLAVTGSAPSADPPTPNPLFNRSLEKGLAVLRAFDVAHRTLTLAELANASGETATLTELVERDMVYLAQLLMSKFIPLKTPVGMCTPMYCTISGRT